MQIRIFKTSRSKLVSMSVIGEKEGVIFLPINTEDKKHGRFKKIKTIQNKFNTNII